MKHLVKNAAVLLLICLAFPVSAYPGPKFPAEVGSVGRAVVSGGNEAVARENEMTDAVSSAFAQYLTEGLGIKVMRENFPRIKQSILPKAQEMMENFLIMAEYRSGSELSVLLGVRFNEKMVQDLLNQSGVAPEADLQRRILVMTAEKTYEGESFWWRDPVEHRTLGPMELAIRKAFERRGFIHVDPGFIVIDDLHPSLKARHLDERRLAEWGSLSGADFVLYGEKDLYRDGHLELYLKAVYANDGVTLAEGRYSGTTEMPVSEGENLLSVLSSVAGEAADELAPAMLGMKVSTPESVVVSVAFEGTGVLVDSPSLQRYMEKGVSGITVVRPARLSESRVVFEVTYRGDPQLLAERLVDGVSPFPLRSTLTREGSIRLERHGDFDRPVQMPRSPEKIGAFGS